MRKSATRFILRSLLLLCLLSICASLCFSEDAQQQEPTLEMLSSNIRQNLLDLKRQSDDMTTRLETLSQDLAKSQSEASQWETQSRTLSRSLTSINDELTQSYNRLSQYEERLRTRARIIAVLGVIILIRAVGMVAALVLYAKRVPVPRWVDILL